MKSVDGINFEKQENTMKNLKNLDSAHRRYDFDLVVCGKQEDIKIKYAMCSTQRSSTDKLSTIDGDTRNL